LPLCHSNLKNLYKIIDTSLSSWWTL
jgi:hypothetical protein